MKINNKIWLGIGVLGAGFLGLANPATAAPRKAQEWRDVQDARRDVREARKDVWQERRDVRQADSQRERREETREWQDARRDLRDEQRELRDERRDLPGYGQNQNQRRTLQGVVIGDLRGNDFVLRQPNGQTVRVIATNGESRRISRGDVVKVYGILNNGDFRAQNISVVRNR